MRTSKAEARAVRAAASIDHLAVLIRRHPYVSLTAVAAAGFALGSVLGSRYGQVAVALGGGFAAHKFLDGAAGPRGLREWVRGELAAMMGDAPQELQPAPH